MPKCMLKEWNILLSDAMTIRQRLEKEDRQLYDSRYKR